MMVQQMKYNSGYDVGAEDDTNNVLINTETVFRTGKFNFRNTAGPAPKIRFDIPVYAGDEPVDDRVITYPANLLAADTPVFADTPVELKGKTIVANLNSITNLVNANIGNAAGIIYSKLNLTGSIVNADISASAAITDDKLAQITNKAKLPSSTVYNNQANAYNSSFQTFIKGFIRLDDLAGHFTSLDNGTQTGNFVLAIPVLGANDTIATRGLTNTFITWQKFQYSAASSPIVLYRADSTPGVGTGIAFNLQNNGATETTYAALYGVVTTNTAGAEDGAYSFQVKKAGVMGEKMILTAAGLLSFGDGANKATFDTSALTNARTIAIPNAGGNMVLHSINNVFNVQQTFQMDSAIQILQRRTNSTVGTVLTGYYTELRDSGGANTAYAKIETRIGTNTDGNETGFLDFYVMKNGSLGQYMVLDGNQLSLGLSGLRAVLDSSNISSSSKTFGFPNLSGQITVNEATQTLLLKTLTSPIINGGALNGSFTGNTDFEFIRDAQASTAELIAKFRIAGITSSYVQFDNASATDGVFSPRLTAVNSAASSNSAVGLYQYINIVATSDTADSTNAVAIFDARRSDGGGTAIVNRRLFQFRNATTNVFEIYTNKFDFTSKRLVNAIFNVDEAIIKHSTTNAQGDLYIHDTTYGGLIRLPRGANGDVLKSTAGGIAWGANIITVADLNDIGNVNTTGAVNGNILQFNGTDWVHSTIGTNGEANTASNVGGGAGTFKDKTAAQLNFRSFLALNSNLTITQNTNDITIGLANTITLPAAAATKFIFSKPTTAGAGENLVAFQSGDDSTGSELLIANATTSDTAFIPMLWFKGYGSSSNAGVIIAETTAALDTGSTALFTLDGRRTGAALVTRPILELRNYTTQEYLFKIDGFDMKGNNLENAVITSTVTGIVDANIAGGAAIATSKLAANGTFAFLGVANIFTEPQTIQKNATNLLSIYRLASTNSSQMGLTLDAWSSTGVKRSYGSIVGVIGDNSNAAENGTIYFMTMSAGTLAARAALNHNGNFFIGVNMRLCLSEAGLTAQRLIQFPDSDTTLVGTADSRLSDARNPLAHFASHQLDGSDPLVLKGFRAAYTAVSTTPVNLSATTDAIVHVDASGGARTLNLPAASTRAGQVYWIQKIDSSANAVTIDANASETINGATTYVLTAQYQMVILMCNGANWTTGPYSSERRGRSTASGNGSSVTFNVPHGLGAVPHDVLIQCSSHNIDLSYTYDATNIVVTFATAPGSGTNNVIFNWSAVP